MWKDTYLYIITEMDRAVQQNAANAEESASAAEELDARAEQLKPVTKVTGYTTQPLRGL